MKPELTHNNDCPYRLGHHCECEFEKYTVALNTGGDLEWFFGGDFAWDEDFTELGVEWHGKFGAIYGDINHNTELSIGVHMHKFSRGDPKRYIRKMFDLRDPELAPFLSKARKMIEDGHEG